MARKLLLPLAASAALAAVSTLGDFVWARWIPEHRAVFGLVHGALLGGAIGLALGLARGRAAAGLMGGAAIVLGAALGFYALRPFLGYSAMFVLWMALWLAFGLLGGRWLGSRHSTSEALTRGTVAAVGSGLAFYLVSGIWRDFDPRTIDYAYHFGCWTLAFLPAFLALLLERPARAT
ncbi:MAG TPA: hypothetical protein VJ648_14005 [Vicinamibacteria bacterium]|nr:hypothetical protein [Vicinamibacteria bacterium]